MALEFTTKICKWDFRPCLTSPVKCRKQLSEYFHEVDEIDTDDLIYRPGVVNHFHSLALICPDFVITSTCKRFIAIPVTEGNVLAVQLRRILTDTSPEYTRAPTMHEAITEALNAGTIHPDAAASFLS